MVHGLVYDVRDGLLANLDISMNGPDHLKDIYHIEKRTAASPRATTNETVSRVATNVTTNVTTRK